MQESYSNFIHNSPKLETTQVPINWWMGKQIMVQSQSEIVAVIKRNELQLHAVIWINPKNISLDKISQIQKSILSTAYLHV